MLGGAHAVAAAPGAGRRRERDRGRAQPARLAVRRTARCRRPAAARRLRPAGRRQRDDRRRIRERAGADARPARHGREQPRAPRAGAASRGARTLLRAAANLRRALSPRPRAASSASFEVLFLHGWAPHESQPKAAAGQAAPAQRLAEALDSVELSAGEKVGAELRMRASRETVRSANAVRRLRAASSPTSACSSISSRSPGSCRSPSAQLGDGDGRRHAARGAGREGHRRHPHGHVHGGLERVVLLGPERVERLPGLGWSARETAFLLHLIKVAGVTFVLIAAFMLHGVARSIPRRLARRRRSIPSWRGARRWRRPLGAGFIVSDLAGAARELRACRHRRRPALRAAPVVGLQPRQRLDDHRRLFLVFFTGALATGMPALLTCYGAACAACRRRRTPPPWSPGRAAILVSYAGDAAWPRPCRRDLPHASGVARAARPLLRGRRRRALRARSRSSATSGRSAGGIG